MLWRSPSPARRPEGFIEPCLPTLGHAVPTGPQWVHEIKRLPLHLPSRRQSDSRVFSTRPRLDRPSATDRRHLRKASGNFGDAGREGVACGPDGVTNFARFPRRARPPYQARSVSLCFRPAGNRRSRPAPRSPGRTAAGSWHASCAALAMASNSPIIWKALTATRSSAMHAPWASKASSRFVAN